MIAAVQTKSEILARFASQGAAIRSLGVKRIGLFGSFVRDAADLGSDVDLLVEFEQGGKSWDNFIRLCFLLEDLFGRRVEVVTLEALSPHIGPRILEEVEYVDLAA